MTPWCHTHITTKSTERVQAAGRLEKRFLKILKGLAEHMDISEAELIDGMSLHCFEGKASFGPEALVKIEQLKIVYGLDLDASDSHSWQERGGVK